MYNKLNIAIFFFAICSFFIVLIALPADPKSPEYENRAMQDFPSINAYNIFNGSFTSDFESFLVDNAAYRTSFLKIASAVEEAYGIRLAGSAISVEINAADLGKGLIPDEEDYDVADTPLLAQLHTLNTVEPTYTPPSDTNTVESTETQSPTIVTKEQPTAPIILKGHVDPSSNFSTDIDFSSDAILYERYSRKNNASELYASALNSYMEGLPDNIRVFSLLAPTRVEFMGEKYKSANDSQYETIEKINSLLDSGIIKVNAYDRIAANTDKYVYFRTDHHWTTLGAYYAYLAYAESAELTPIKIENYIEHYIPNYIGSLAKGTNNKTILNHPDTMYYYELDIGITFSNKMFFIPEDISKLSYRIFLGGDHAKLDITSSNANGKTLVVVKDSYANALIPWIAPHYERIIVIDPRQYGGSVVTLLKDLGEADLLFIDYVLATEFTDFVTMIKNAK